MSLFPDTILALPPPRAYQVLSLEQKAATFFALLPDSPFWKIA